MTQPILVRSVSGNLYRGPRPDSGDDLTMLSLNFGIQTIVSLETGFGRFWDSLWGRAFAEREIWEQSFHRTYLSRPCSNFLPPSRAETEAIIRDIKAALQRGPVYLHCYAGVDRTGWICAAWRVLEQGWDPEKAWMEAVQLGLHARYFWWSNAFHAEMGNG